VLEWRVVSRERVLHLGRRVRTRREPPDEAFETVVGDFDGQGIFVWSPAMGILGRLYPAAACSAPFQRTDPVRFAQRFLGKGPRVIETLPGPRPVRGRGVRLVRRLLPGRGRARTALWVERFRGAWGREAGVSGHAALRTSGPVVSPGCAAWRRALGLPVRAGPWALCVDNRAAEWRDPPAGWRTQLSPRSAQGDRASLGRAPTRKWNGC